MPELADELVRIQTEHLGALMEVASRMADRIGQDVTSVEFDATTGELLDSLSDAARAAKYAIAKKIIQQGGEDLGWGR